MHADVYFEMSGKVYYNNSVVSMLDIGEGDAALLCKTNEVPCCRREPNRCGNFYYPNGQRVPIKRRNEGFYRNRGNHLVRLNRRVSTTSPTGTFCCEIPGACGKMNKICINIMSG